MTDANEGIQRRAVLLGAAAAVTLPWAGARAEAAGREAPALAKMASDGALPPLAQRLPDQLQDELGLAYVFISHDIGVIRYMCDRVAVMHRGRVVETGRTDDVCDRPTHGYTRALLSAIPRPDPRARRLHERFRYVA